MSGRRARGVLFAGTLLLALPTHPATAACRSSCTEELRACRAGCAALHSQTRRQCRQRCSEQTTCEAPGARFRAFAYVDVQCETSGPDTTLSEKLLVRRGNCDPVTVMELPPAGPVPDPLGLCRLYGALRFGAGSIVVGRFQRIGARSDGSGFVFEVTHGNSLFPPLSPAPPQEGIFFVRADGKGLRNLGPPSKVPLLGAVPDPGSSIGVSFFNIGNRFFGVSPNGRLIAFEDKGPGPAGEDAEQIVVVDVASGRRTQLTHLPPALPGRRPTCCPFFSTNDRLFFFNGPAGDEFTVRVDGGELEQNTDIVPVPGATVVQRFGIVGSGTNAITFALPGVPKVRYTPTEQILELFFVDGGRVLQLTNFGYPDTALSGNLGPEQAFFGASADPFGTNPAGVCQVFSVSPLGGALRQLTHLPADSGTKIGCEGATAPGAMCTLAGVAQDPVTHGVAFTSSCDPLGRNPYGEQTFSMRPDGTGLRQTSAFRGTEELPDGNIRVELGGPTAGSVRFN